jgi:hypothetical protein
MQINAMLELHGRRKQPRAFTPSYSSASEKYKQDAIEKRILMC